MWDTTTEFGQRIARRLAEELIIWLVTTGKDGTPQPSPVWFVWDGETVLIFSKPDAPKVRNIQACSRVALHFNSDARGWDVVVFTSTAALDPRRRRRICCRPTSRSTAPASPISA